MTTQLTFTTKVHFKTSRHGRRRMVGGVRPEAEPAPVGRVPRVARLMALAVRLQSLIERGEVRDYAELARLGHVTRARVTQIMNLLNLAPDIQHAILALPLTTEGRDPIKEWQVRPIAAEPDWRKQRFLWRRASPKP